MQGSVRQGDVMSTLKEFFVNYWWFLIIVVVGIVVVVVRLASKRAPSDVG